GQLGTRRDQLPRRRDRREERVADRERLVGVLRRAPVPALVARPQVEHAVDEQRLAAVVGRARVDRLKRRLAGQLDLGLVRELADLLGALLDDRRRRDAVRVRTERGDDLAVRQRERPGQLAWVRGGAGDVDRIDLLAGRD